MLPCGHHESNMVETVESKTKFCRQCDIESRCRDAETREKELFEENRSLRATVSTLRIALGMNDGDVLVKGDGDGDYLIDTKCGARLRCSMGVKVYRELIAERDAARERLAEARELLRRCNDRYGGPNSEVASFLARSGGGQSDAAERDWEQRYMNTEPQDEGG